MQDTATAPPTKQAPPPPRDLRLRSRREVVRVLVLGTQVWVIGCAWPLMDAGRDPSALEYGCALCALIALVAGARVPGPDAAADGWRSWLRPGCWLTAFPAALAAACAVRPEYWNQLHYGSVGAGLLWFTLGVYGAKAAAVSAEPGLRVRSTATALEPEAGAQERAAVGWQRRSWTLLCGAGAIAIGLIAPTWAGVAALERDWGPAASSGGVLTAVVGGALAAAILGVYMAEGLRDRVPAAPASRREIAGRALAFVLLALLGVGTYLVIGS